MIDSKAQNRINKLIEKLTLAFGERVKIRNEYHIQIAVERGSGYHDVWVNKFGQAKWKRHGKSSAKHAQDAEAIIASIGREAGPTDLAKMQEQMELATMIRRAKRMLDGQAAAVWVDAGFKDGIGQIAAVLVVRETNGVRVKAESFCELSESIHAAERLAIEFGAWHVAGREHCTCPIYTDSKNATAGLPESLSKRVQWIGREKNKVADKVANLRN